VDRTVLDDLDKDQGKLETKQVSILQAAIEQLDTLAENISVHET
jgi:hypothetical protein